MQTVFDVLFAMILVPGGAFLGIEYVCLVHDMSLQTMALLFKKTHTNKMPLENLRFQREVGTRRETVYPRASCST